MNIKWVKNSVIIIFWVILINGAFFTCIPQLSQQDDFREHLDYQEPVFLKAYQPPPPPKPQERKLPEPKPKPKEIPRVKMDQNQPPPTKPKLDLDLNFEINANLGVGLSVPPPTKGYGGSTIFNESELDQEAKVLMKVKPFYPYLARRRGIEGRVRLKFIVNESGQVQSPKVLEASPEGIFEDCALAAVQKYRFKPGYLSGKPVSSWKSLTINFNLEED